MTKRDRGRGATGLGRAFASGGWWSFRRIQKKGFLRRVRAQARTAGASAIAERKSFRARECESWSRWPFAGMK